MKLTLAAICLLATSLTSTAFAGGDSLKCSSSNGIVIDGSLWGKDGRISIVRINKGSKLSVTTTGNLAENAQILLESQSAEIQKAIIEAKATLMQPSDEYRRDILIVAPLAKPVYLVKEDREECRDIGNYEYTQKASLITVGLEYNSKLNKSEVVVTKEKLDLNCQYDYATTMGGRCQDVGN